MKTLINDLHVYEFVLLLLGVFLFLILSGALVYYIYKRENIKRLLFFFPIPIIMIGYPSIKEFKISSDKIEFSRYQEAYAKNPENEALRKKIEDLSVKLEERLKAPEDLIMLSKAKVLLAKPDEALHLVNKAVNKIEEQDDFSKTISDKNKDNLNQTVAKAKQIKALATVQKNAIQKKDTLALNQKINAVQLTDPELVKTVNAIKINTQKKVALTNFKAQQKIIQ